MRLYQLTGAYRELQQLADDGEDVSVALDQIEDELAVKAEGIAAVLRGLRADQDALRREEKRLADRRRALERNEERLRAYIRDCMVDAGLERVKCSAFTISLKHSDKVEIERAEALPPEYIRTKLTVEPDKAAILEAHRKSGECVPGTRIVQTISLIVK